MTEMTASGFLLLLLLAVLLGGAGAALGYLVARARASAAEDAVRAGQAAEQSQWAQERSDLNAQLARVQGELQSEQRAHADTRAERDWQRDQNGRIDNKMLPLSAAFKALTDQVEGSERARLQSQAELTQKVTDMAQQFTAATADVRHEARKLSQVMSRTERRGAWGEMQLRTLVESAGMLPHVHFVEQDHNATEEGPLRPDMVIDLAGGRRVVVDSKVPLDAFLRMDAAQEDNDEETMRLHAQAVHQHIQRLSSKEYWRLYESPEFVVMFLPSEGLLSAALQTRPDLLQHALDKKVILATPTTLLSMLHAITHSWRQVEAAEQAREIQRLGAELYQRVVGMAQKFDQLGKAITRSVEAYDGTISTLETRVLPSGRRMAKMSGAADSIPALPQIERATRDLSDTKWPSDNNGTDAADSSLADETPVDAVADAVADTSDNPSDASLDSAAGDRDADVADIVDPQQSRTRRKGRAA